MRKVLKCSLVVIDENMKYIHVYIPISYPTNTCILKYTQELSTMFFERQSFFKKFIYLIRKRIVSGNLVKFYYYYSSF